MTGDGVDESIGGAQMVGGLHEPFVEWESAGRVMSEDGDGEPELRGGGAASMLASSPLILDWPNHASLFDMSFASGTVGPPRLLPHFPSKNGHTPSPPLPCFHLSYSTPLKFHRRCLPPLVVQLPPPYGPIKGEMRAPPLSTAPTSTPISPPRDWSHLPIGAPPAASVERRRVTIYAVQPPSGTIGENPDDIL
jgi:hypothetical protein